MIPDLASHTGFDLFPIMFASGEDKEDEEDFRWAKCHTQNVSVG